MEIHSFLQSKSTQLNVSLYIPCILPWTIHGFPLHSMTGWNRKAPSWLAHLASYCLANKSTAKWTESHLFPSNYSAFFLQYWIVLDPSESILSTQD